jgi:prepilin-type N-terminal cleavage/methylation domain-containing protein
MRLMAKLTARGRVESGSLQQSGFTLIEGVMAIAIVGISFVAVFGLVSIADRSLQNTIEKERMKMQARQIVETVAADLQGQCDYTGSWVAAGGGVQCPPFDKKAMPAQQRMARWCQRMEDGLTTSRGDQRTVRVRPLTGGQPCSASNASQRVIEVVLKANGGRAQVVMKQVVYVSP